MGNGYDILEAEGKREASGMWLGFVFPGLGLGGVSPPQADFPTVGTTEVLSITLSPLRLSAVWGSEWLCCFLSADQVTCRTQTQQGASTTYIMIYNTAQFTVTEYSKSHANGECE